MHSERIVDYYTEAGPDYSLWSRQFNMHFGFYRMGMNPFDLEGMLDRMNFEVLDRLCVDAASPQHLLDMGCGLGATARYAARMLPQATLSGLTLVPWQAERAAALNRATGVEGRVRVVRGDYAAAPFPAESFDGVYALESSCYAPGSAKEPLVREMFRLLKPGKRFAVADAFLKTERWMDPLTRACCKALYECWSLETLGEIHQFARFLQAAGFREIRIENISRNVTPSVLHVPRPMIRFILRELRNPRPNRARKRWGNMMAGLFLILFALDRSRSGYFMVSGAKP
jgi:cyclopropane fatty-acyl-phospholipid synthase-like methyltransferase